MGFGEGGRFEKSLDEDESLREKVDQLWAWLIEKSAEDTQKASVVRKQLYQHLNKLGVVNSSGIIDVNAWCGFVASQIHRKTNPIKPDNYPNFETFKDKFDEYQKGSSDILELKRHTTAGLPEYFYALGIIMSDKIVYESVFENDDIQIKNSRVENGKHREATMDILRMCGFDKQMPWVKVEYEK